MTQQAFQAFWDDESTIDPTQYIMFFPPFSIGWNPATKKDELGQIVINSGCSISILDWRLVRLYLSNKDGTLWSTNKKTRQ